MAVLTFEQVLEARSSNYLGDPRLDVLKEMAPDYIHQNVPKDGNVYTMALVLQVLHWLTLSDRNNGDMSKAVSAGPIKKIKTGDETIEYAASGSTGASPLQYISDMKKELDQTPWGTELYGLMSRYFMRARTRFS